MPVKAITASSSRRRGRPGGNQLATPPRYRLRPWQHPEHHDSMLPITYGPCRYLPACLFREPGAPPQADGVPVGLGDRRSARHLGLPAPAARAPGPARAGPARAERVLPARRDDLVRARVPLRRPPHGPRVHGRRGDRRQAGGIGPSEANLERHTVYTFRARRCDSGRRGRLLLAGGSAHLMPPFARAGYVLGLRDAVNLVWKLNLVLDGRADDQILDSYGPERAAPKSRPGRRSRARTGSPRPHPPGGRRQDSWPVHR